MKPNRIAGVLCLFTCLSIAHGEPTSQPARPQPGLQIEKYDNGQTKSSYSVDAKGTRSGSYTLFSEDGKRTERGTYKNGDLDGLRQTYYPNGTMSLQESYRRGKLDGQAMEYDERGGTTRSAQFSAGTPTADRTIIDGMLIYPRSAAMISAELEKIRAVKIETLRAASAIPAHEGEKEPNADREDAVRRLMEYRYLSYVPYVGMALDPVYSAHDEAAAAILAKIGKLDHTPANPGWPEDKYKFAYTGTSSSNLDQGGGDKMNLHSVDAYMDDSDSSNIDRVGHRRWCLNPRMGKVGFGAFKNFSAMWSMDSSRKDVPQFDYVAYPGPGLYPKTHFGARRAWSISLSELKYLKPGKTGVTVAVTPVEIQHAQNKITPAGKALDIDYNAVELSGFGISNCIIFRPTGIKMTPGSAYMVEVMGLKGTNSKPAVIRYVVEFFDPGAQKTTAE